MWLHLVKQFPTVEVYLLLGAALMIEAQLLKSAEMLDLTLTESYLSFGFAPLGLAVFEIDVAEIHGSERHVPLTN